MTTYPIDPLAHALGIELGKPGHPADDAAYGITALAEALDCSETNVKDMHRLGMSRRQAERYAPRAGRHPAGFWADWWTTDDLDPCRFDECPEVCGKRSKQNRPPPCAGSVPRWWCECEDPDVAHRHCLTCEGFIRPQPARARALAA